LKHRGEPRGAGGIFFDYLDGGDWERDFDFVRAVGEAFLAVYPAIVRQRMRRPWTDEQRRHRLVRRGRYAEFNRSTTAAPNSGSRPAAMSRRS
jgi:coproporphyrinogen III oxidase